jgi:hypothetical protein
MPGTGATTEWSLLLAACSTIPPQGQRDRIGSLLKNSIDWKSVFDLADKHGALPLLHQSLVTLPDRVPCDAMASLNQSHQKNLIKALLVSRELIRIVERLTALGLDVMPYKGPALAEVIYGDVAQRQSGDIDLLIRPHNLAAARDAVRELGYTPHMALSAAEERAYLKSGYEYAFDGTAGPNLLELQWAIQPRFYAIDFDMDAMFQRGVTIEVAGQPMKTPSLEDLFLVLSVHAAKHVWGRLVWLCDLARMISMPTLNWKWIGLQAAELGIVRILHVTMLLANRLLGAEMPAAARENLPAGTAARALADEIEAQFPDNNYNVDSLAYFRLMSRLRERRTDRMRFAWRLALTPGPGEWNAVRLPATLFPFYRQVRLSRLAARLARL